MANAKTPWYLTRTFVLILIGTVGPLGLPFLLLSPKFNGIWKFILTLCVIVLTVAFFKYYPALERELNRQVAVIRELYPELTPYLPK